MMQFAILSGPTGETDTRLIADLSRKTTALTIATNEHGAAELQASVHEPSLAAQFRIADRQGLPWCYVGDGTLPGAYVGRLEDVTIAGDGLELGAFGAYRALSDVPYTALWSDTSTAGWFVLDERMLVEADPNRFNISFNNRVFIGARKGAIIGTSPFILGAAGFVTPSQSSRVITNLTFNYSLTAAAGGATWGAELQQRTAPEPVTGAWTYLGTAAWSITAAAGATTSGTASVALSPTANGVFFYLYRSAANAAITDEDDANRLTITNLRVTSQATPIEADDIASALLTYTNGINSGQLRSVTSRIQSPGLDLYREVYEDQTPADILDRLARLGDTSGRPWRAWVGADRILTFEPWGDSGRTWFVDVTDLEVQRTLETLYNSVYAIYQDASNRTLRTAAASHSGSISRYGLTRREAIGADTTSSAQAAYERDTHLSDRATPPARAGIAFDAVYTAYGARAPLWAPRAGDTFVLRNLAPSLSVDIDKLRVIRIGRTVWDVVANTLRVEPQIPIPTLETMLAQKENRNAR